MKYKIIKGSEKDFDGAPEWAMQVATCRDDEDMFFVDEFDYMCRYQRKSSTANGRISNPTFWKVIAERRPITDPELKPIYGDGIHDDTEALQQRIDMGIDINDIIVEKGKVFNISSSLQLKTITEPVWDGEGLPPVGVECETLNKEYGRWYKVRIIFSDLVRRVAWEEVGDEYFNIDCDNSSDLRIFRPIRSPEDVAMDEVGLAIYHAINWNAKGELVSSSRMEDYKKAYDAIVAGKIPGIVKTPTVSELMRVTKVATREDCEAIVKMLSGKTNPTPPEMPKAPPMRFG